MAYTQIHNINFKGLKSRKQIMVSSIFPKNEQNTLSWVEKMLMIVSFVCFLEEFKKP